MYINVKRLNDFAVVPVYQTEGAAGFDLHATEDIIIMPKDTGVLVGTGLAFELPFGTELQIRPRSGMSTKTTIRVANSPGTIDCDFRGEVKIILDNLGDFSYHISKGDRIAQGVLVPYLKGDFRLSNELSETKRGEKGFGSTGT